MSRGLRKRLSNVSLMCNHWVHRSRSAEWVSGSAEIGGMSSSRKRMLSGSLMSIFIMVALIALNHKLV
jgi:hypothetical protein